jgi:hypothetical protein
MVLSHLLFLPRRRAAVHTSAAKLLSQLKSIGHTPVLAERFTSCRLCVMHGVALRCSHCLLLL